MDSIYLGPLWEHSAAPEQWVTLAQVLRGPFNEVNDQPKKSDPTVPMQIRAGVDLNLFQTNHTTLEVDGSGKVTTTYKIQDFRGPVPEFAQWEAVIETQCKRFEVVKGQNHSNATYIRYGTNNPIIRVPIHAANLDEVPLTPDIYRWVPNRKKVTYVFRSPGRDQLQALIPPDAMNGTRDDPVSVCE